MQKISTSGAGDVAQQENVFFPSPHEAPGFLLSTKKEKKNSVICKDWYICWKMFYLAGYVTSSKYTDSVNLRFLLYKWDNNLTSQGCPKTE